ncbi:uncharacterized protein LOC106178334 [Lingula anatina]|uniref:Uncharacterized protein LOC106178334 n=1 Tax=Lingula anatina TaxID=7574 RepID=A0A1S3K2Q8_LINAN|nr:uncharacterized protein LOC106178334 [Lingula anatina]|eukprot:XP_013416925.1 uncharacterized protein LOC106178334 [Lingula anatina]
MSDEGRTEGGVDEDNPTAATTEVTGTAATTETFDFHEFLKSKIKEQPDDEESTVDKYCSVISLLLFGIVTLVIIIAGVTSYRILIVVSISKIKENRTDASYHFTDSISDNVTALVVENFEKIEKLRWYCLLLGSMLAPVVLGFIGSVSSACLQSARKKGTKFMPQGFCDQQTGASMPVGRKMPLGAFAKRIIFLIFLVRSQDGNYIFTQFHDPSIVHLDRRKKRALLYSNSQHKAL